MDMALGCPHLPLAMGIIGHVVRVMNTAFRAEHRRLFGTGRHLVLRTANSRFLGRASDTLDVERQRSFGFLGEYLPYFVKMSVLVGDTATQTRLRVFPVARK